MTERTFTPALGRLSLPKLYDAVIALTRERLWRSMTAMHAAPTPNAVIIDVGCGTGSLALLLHRIEPTARVIGVDPDPKMLTTARQKSTAAGTDQVEWHTGMGNALTDIIAPQTADIIVSSLVFHQCPVPMKRAILISMLETLRPGGKLVIADFGLQRTRLMRLAFRIVQLADGKEDTQFNADGALPDLMTDVGFHQVQEPDTIPTINGSISIYTARRP
ncbi:class I SAM-dependent methyltransferase [Nonomuraea gerenzanensis]|uniref:Ubiquinone/menaquinone biosynthesis methyltransferase UbiE n=1 Tax=Nonomuraea gerenzanensis TaxID=93944 RepID=A0A1M4DYM2_9ACTN|nr:class I SAM-dependent methyltransferase [Nonomuraea gerenzanensis]UBU13966.1 class I SAM-dependent methyltransferase [Nonomuraea gerenzanensis]SBO91651.1 Ubiquinone/menaquinone biosynthesis methyltransferase UbiE [Nonomuraea gerenzanensis]